MEYLFLYIISFLLERFFRPLQPKKMPLAVPGKILRRNKKVMPPGRFRFGAALFATGTMPPTKKNAYAALQTAKNYDLYRNYSKTLPIFQKTLGRQKRRLGPLAGRDARNKWIDTRNILSENLSDKTTVMKRLKYLVCALVAAFALTACDGNGEEEEPPRYEYYSFVLDSESDGLILDVAYSGLLPDGALVIPESCYYYAEEEGGGITRHDEPKNIVAIADGAFENCARITSVTLPMAVS